MRIPLIIRLLAWAIAPILVFSCSGLDEYEDDDELPAWDGADVDGHEPGGDDGFFAYYTRLDSGEPFERVAYVSEYADVVVNLGADRHFVFWRASSYRPHGSVDGERVYVDATHERTDTTSTRLLLTGLSGVPDDQLVDLARSWLDAPPLTDVRGATDARYDETERAWHLRADGDRAAFSVMASEASPAVNPVFVVADWSPDASVEVRVDGEVRQGVVRNTSGERTLVVFVPMRAAEPIDV